MEVKVRERERERERETRRIPRKQLIESATGWTKGFAERIAAVPETRLRAKNFFRERSVRK